MVPISSSPVLALWAKSQARGCDHRRARRIEAPTPDTNDPSDTLRSQNPLGKIPALILDGGEALYDSRVILDVSTRSPAVDGSYQRMTRFEALRLQALADGIMDAALLQRLRGPLASGDAP